MALLSCFAQTPAFSTLFSMANLVQFTKNNVAVWHWQARSIIFERGYPKSWQANTYKPPKIAYHLYSNPAVCVCVGGGCLNLLSVYVNVVNFVNFISPIIFLTLPKKVGGRGRNSSKLKFFICKSKKNVWWQKKVALNNLFLFFGCC